MVFFNYLTSVTRRCSHSAAVSEPTRSRDSVAPAVLTSSLLCAARAQTADAARCPFAPGARSCLHAGNARTARAPRGAAARRRRADGLDHHLRPCGAPLPPRSSIFVGSGCSSFGATLPGWPRLAYAGMVRARLCPALPLAHSSLAPPSHIRPTWRRSVR